MATCRRYLLQETGNSFANFKLVTKVGALTFSERQGW